MHIKRQENGKKIRLRLHTLIAILFVENPNNYKYVNHIDSNKTNNHPSNLEWCTNSENIQHGWNSGNRTHKNNTHVVVYDLEGNHVGTFTSLRQMAEKLSVDRHVVARILKGERRNNYPYVFEYEQSQSTIENIATEKDGGEEVSRVH